MGIEENRMSNKFSVPKSSPQGNAQNKPNTSDLDLNMIGSSGFNCLHAACGSGNIEMTDYLLFKRMVNPNILGKDGWSPLEIAVQTGIIEIVQFLLKD